MIHIFKEEGNVLIVYDEEILEDESTNLSKGNALLILEELPQKPHAEEGYYYKPQVENGIFSWVKTKLEDKDVVETE